MPRIAAAVAALMCAVALPAPAHPAEAGAAPEDADRRGLEATGGVGLRYTRLGRDHAAQANVYAMVYPLRWFGLGGVYTSSLAGDGPGRWFGSGAVRAEFLMFPGRNAHLMWVVNGGIGGLTRIDRDDPGRQLYGVVEGEVVVALDLAKYARLAAHGGWRWAPAIGAGAGRPDLNGPYAGLALHFGVLGAPGRRGGTPDLRVSAAYSIGITGLLGRAVPYETIAIRASSDDRLILGLRGARSLGAFRGDSGVSYDGGWGAFEVAYAFFPRSPVRLVVGGAVGMGGAAGARRGYGDAFAAFVEPEVTAQATPLSFMRIEGGASWRQAVCIRCSGPFSAVSLSGPAARVTVSFGWF